VSNHGERCRNGKRDRRQSDRAVAAPEPSGISSPGLPGYRVRIVYTEPEFQERNPQCPREFSLSQDYPGAGSPQEALRKAVDFFDFCAENSSVGWRRVLHSVTVERC